MSTLSARAGTGRHGATAVEEVARRHPWLVALGRAGWSAKGAVFVVAGALAFSISTSDQGTSGSGGAGGDPGAAGAQEASQSGAMARIAESSAGTAALWAIGIGLLLYAAWRVVTILLPAENTAKVWGARAGWGISALTYGALAWTAISLASDRASSSAQSENGRVERWTADLMGHTGGRWLVGLVGLVVVATGAYFAYLGITARFRDELEPRGVGPLRQEPVVKLGQAGHLGRAATNALVGFFLARAAWTFDPDEAEGLDGALRRLVDTGWGPAVVVFVGIGLVLFGAFCIVSAPIRRLQGAR